MKIEKPGEMSFTFSSCRLFSTQVFRTAPALIRLKQRVIVSDSVAPIPLPERDQDHGSTSGRLGSGHPPHPCCITQIPQTPPGQPLCLQGRIRANPLHARRGRQHALHWKHDAWGERLLRGRGRCSGRHGCWKWEYLRCGDSVLWRGL